MTSPDTNETTAPNRVAIVTGASGGIGRAIAERLAFDDIAVAVHYHGNAAAASAVTTAIEAVGGTAMTVAGDVADPDEMSGMFDEVVRRFGGIDVVVNTAAIMELATLQDTSIDSFDRIHRTNVRGAFVVSKLAAHHVRSGGAIINFSTSVTRMALPTYSAYAASKAAVEAFTPILAKELRGRGITVNSVAPGPTATPLFLDGKDDATIERLASMPPLERLGRPDDIAETVAHLATSARWINAQTIYVNGGIA